MKCVLPGLALTLLPLAIHAQLAPNAPLDDPRSLSQSQFEAMEKAVEPIIAQARASYPAARDRYLAGLPAGETFFITTRLKDDAGRVEQVFIRVQRIIDGRIQGVIANDLNLVRGFRAGQPYSLGEADLVDWLISKPDGSEEGNLLGKFIEANSPQPPRESQENPPVPEHLLPAIELAQRRGRLLAMAVPLADKATRAQIREARKQGMDPCGFDYKYVSIVDGTEPLVYLIGATKRQTDIIAGRHYQVTTAGAVRSTNTCLNMGTPAERNGERPVAVTMTHLLSESPSEYHVYLSLVQPVMLAVLTEKATWLVRSGEIHLYRLEAR